MGLIEYVMKEKDDKKRTALHCASNSGHYGIVQLLLNTFSPGKKDKLIEYVTKEAYKKYTALHMACFNGHDGIVELLLNTFNEGEKDKLIQYVRKEDHINHTAFHFASFAVKKHPRIINLLNNYMQ